MVDVLYGRWGSLRQKEYSLIAGRGGIVKLRIRGLTCKISLQVDVEEISLGTPQVIEA